MNLQSNSVCGQFLVFAAGRDEGGQVGIGVFPEGEQVLIGFAAFREIAGQGGGASQPAQPRYSG